MIDVDFFKTVNDTYGHSGGDEVLKALANTLDNFISEPNIVGRIGGEEFLAVIFNEDGDNISKFCDKLRSNIHAVKVDYEGQSITITASGGIALTAESGNASDVVNKADKRLYEAKKTGRDKFILKN
jgi:diguanylate cyclase (GGDEF)-like protein